MNTIRHYMVMRVVLASGAFLLSLWASNPALAGLLAGTHMVDGQFTSPSEWDTTRASVVETSFPVVGMTGGANVFAEQANNVLNLMFDYTNSNTLGLNTSNSIVEIFFRVPNQGEDYAVKFAGSSFTAFTKPSDGPVSPLTPDGSLDLSSQVWSPMSSTDLARANFVTAIGFGHNPATPSVPDHLLAEIQVGIQL